MGTITGGVSGYKYAKDNGLDPWSGRSQINENQLYEIGDGVRRAKILESLGEKSILVENSSGEIFEVPIKNLRSNLKISIPKDLRYEQLYRIIKIEGQKYPIYVHPGNKGIPVRKIKFE